MNQQRIVFANKWQKEQYIFKVIERAFNKSKNSCDLSTSFIDSDDFCLKYRLTLEDLPDILRKLAQHQGKEKKEGKGLVLVLG